MSDFFTDIAKASQISTIKLEFLENLYAILTNTANLEGNVFPVMARQANIIKFFSFYELERAIKEEDVCHFIDCLNQQDKKSWARVLNWCGDHSFSEKHEEMFFKLFKDISPLKNNLVLLCRRAAGLILIDGGDLSTLLWEALDTQQESGKNIGDFVAVLPQVTLESVETFGV